MEGEHRGTGEISGNSGSGRVVFGVGDEGRVLACWKLDGRQGDLRGGQCGTELGNSGSREGEFRRVGRAMASPRD